MSKIVTPNVLSPLAFSAQVNLSVSNLRKTMIAEQQLTHLLVSAIDKQNQLPTALDTNYMYVAYDNIYQGLHFIQ